MLRANVDISVEYLGSTEDRNLTHAWENREEFPKGLSDKNGKRCHPLNPFKQVSQIKKTEQVYLGEKGRGWYLRGQR